MKEKIRKKKVNRLKRRVKLVRKIGEVGLRKGGSGEKEKTKVRMEVLTNGKDITGVLGGVSGRFAGECGGNRWLTSPEKMENNSYSFLVEGGRRGYGGFYGGCYDGGTFGGGSGCSLYSGYGEGFKGGSCYGDEMVNNGGEIIGYCEELKDGGFCDGEWVNYGGRGLQINGNFCGFRDGLIIGFGLGGDFKGSNGFKGCDGNGGGELRKLMDESGWSLEFFSVVDKNRLHFGDKSKGSVVNSLKGDVIAEIMLLGPPLNLWQWQGIPRAWLVRNAMPLFSSNYRQNFVPTYLYHKPFYSKLIQLSFATSKIITPPIFLSLFLLQPYLGPKLNHKSFSLFYSQPTILTLTSLSSPYFLPLTHDLKYNGPDFQSNGLYIYLFQSTVNFGILILAYLVHFKSFWSYEMMGRKAKLLMVMEESTSNVVMKDWWAYWINRGKAMTDHADDSFQLMHGVLQEVPFTYIPTVRSHNGTVERCQLDRVIQLWIGSECEYRHSEYARVNPRDCYYWLNGNCLNPKCSFRHPPLEGLVGPQTGNFSGPPTVAAPAPTVPAAPLNPTKQGVPCIFFQKGYCLKGDRCPFMHGPNPAITKIQQQVPASAATPEAPAFKKTFGGLEKCTQPKGNFQVNAPKVVEVPAKANVAPKVQSTRPTNGPVGRGYQPPTVVIEEASKYKEIKHSLVDNGNLRSRTGRTHHGGSSDELSFQNGRDADDSLRESSPGFDVLVHDKLSDDEYYHNEEQFARMRGSEGHNGHQDDFDLVADVDPEISHNRRGYDSFDHVPDKYSWDHRRALSERSIVERAHHDRRGPNNKSRSPDFSHNSDLRRRLSSKQRRIDGLKSVNADYNIDAHAEDRGYRSSRRDSHQSSIHETSRSHRLQGRIKLPRSDPMRGNEIYSERDNERGRNWGRSSPSRQQVFDQPNRLRDRLRGNLESHEGRRVSGPMMRKDTFPVSDSDFAGPRSLSELRSTKPADSWRHQVKSQQSVGGKLRDSVLPSSMGTDGDLSFEGPKPLSEILKRKRKDLTDDTNFGNKKEIKQSQNDVKLTSSVSNSGDDAGKQVTLSSAVEQAMTSEVVNKTVDFEVEEEEDGEISNKKIKLNGEDKLSSLNDDNDYNKHPEVGEIEVTADDEEQEFDGEYDQGDGEYDYEQEDGEGYDLNEIGPGEQEVDSMDEDDGDDFAKTLGVSF